MSVGTVTRAGESIQGGTGDDATGPVIASWGGRTLKLMSAHESAIVLLGRQDAEQFARAIAWVRLPTSSFE